MSITFINPIGECLIPVKPYTLSTDLNNPTRVALVINKIVDCDVFMNLIGTSLKQARPNVTLTSYETDNITFADSTLIDQIATENDVAICAIGHCGSCTAGTIKDGIALVEQNIPAVSLVTELFWDQGNSLSRALGWPDFPRVKLPYPVWGTSKDEMQFAANNAVSFILPLLEPKDVNAA